MSTLISPIHIITILLYWYCVPLYLINSPTECPPPPPQKKKKLAQLKMGKDIYIYIFLKYIYFFLGGGYKRTWQPPHPLTDWTTRNADQPNETPTNNTKTLPNHHEITRNTANHNECLKDWNTCLKHMFETNRKPMISNGAVHGISHNTKCALYSKLWDPRWKPLKNQ